MRDPYPTARLPNPVPSPSMPAVPLLLPILGGLWWIVGTTALGAGLGTVLLAGGIALVGALVIALRRRFGTGARLAQRVRARFVRIVVVTVVVIVACSIALGAIGYGELAVPLACGLCGLALFPLAPLLDDRAIVALGAALLVLAAAGAVLALDSAGRLYPQGVVGLLAGAACWLAAAYTGGLVTELRRRLR